MDPIYELHDAKQLITPCLLVYPQIIRTNLQAAIDLAGGVDRLRLHVKTHKSPDIVRMELELGLTKHKCATLREAQMLAQCGVPDVFIAYPQVGPAVKKLKALSEEFPQTRFSTTVDNLDSARELEAEFLNSKLSLDVWVDIDSGMHRTGIPAGESACELYAWLARSAPLRPAGLHIYDGQNHQPDLADRRAAVSALLQPVRTMLGQLDAKGYSVPKLVCGGTPTFPVYATWDVSDWKTEIECSPGTCVLSDFNYGSDYPDLSGIRHAAILMTRVISKQVGSDTLTVDLGHKAVAADPPAGQRIHFLNVSEASEGKQNEEHLVVHTPQAERYSVGDVLYAVPAHICPTVALHQEVHCVEDNRLCASWPISGRDRLYRC